MKINLCIIWIFILLFSTSCSNETKNINIEVGGNETVEITMKNIEDNNVVAETGHVIELNSYAYKDINVLYPSVKGLPSAEIESKVNELLKTEALSFIELIGDGKDELFFELGYEVVYESDTMLSIRYNGSRYMNGAPYPVDVFFTTNIDLVNATKLSLANFLNINDLLVNSYVACINKETEDELVELGYQYIRESYTEDEIMKHLEMADSSYGESAYIFSYFTGSTIGISWEVPHVIGDHVEVEIPIDVLTESLSDKIIKELK